MQEKRILRLYVVLLNKEPSIICRPILDDIWERTISAKMWPVIIAGNTWMISSNLHHPWQNHQNIGVKYANLVNYWKLVSQSQHYIIIKRRFWLVDLHCNLVRLIKWVVHTKYFGGFALRYRNFYERVSDRLYQSVAFSNLSQNNSMNILCLKELDN